MQIESVSIVENNCNGYTHAPDEGDAVSELRSRLACAPTRTFVVMSIANRRATLPASGLVTVASSRSIVSFASSSCTARPYGKGLHQMAVMQGPSHQLEAPRQEAIGSHVGAVRLEC